MIARMIALTAVVAYTIPAGAQPASGAPPELDRVQLSVVLSPRTGQAMGNESVALKRAVEAGLASRGMGTAVSDLSSRFVAYVDLVPIQEEQAPGGMVVVKEQLSITFGEATGGPSIGLFQAERTAVGKNKEGALRNFSTSLKLATNRDFITSLDAANTGIIDYFERQCAGLIREADAKV